MKTNTFSQIKATETAGFGIDDSCAGPVIWPDSERWTFDRGAMPGEPFAYLDGDVDTCIAAMVEVQSGGKPPVYEVRRRGGSLLSQAESANDAAKDAEARLSKGWKNADEAFEQLNSILDASGALESKAIMAATYRLRMVIAHGLGDLDRAKIAEECLSELNTPQD